MLFFNIFGVVVLINFDLVVIGSGAGMNVASSAVGLGMKVALIDKDPLGGTCLNRGCIPSKVLIYPADVIRVIQDAKAVGVNAKIENVDYDFISKRMWATVLEGRHAMEVGVKQDNRITFYPNTSYFVSDYTLKVANEEIYAKKIIIAVGARPKIPDISGLNKTGFLTSETIFSIKQPPKSLIIIGGGYIASEFGHFFSSVGTAVTIIGRNSKLVSNEEPEICDLLKKKLSKHIIIHTSNEPVKVGVDNDLKVVTIQNVSTGETSDVSGEEILIAVGVKSNADLLKPENSGIDITSDGWIKVNQSLETSKKNIWAIGDVIGRYLYRHTANYESDIVIKNALYSGKQVFDEHAVPHAVFTYPQIGSVGLTESEARKNHKIYVGIGKYSDTAKGYSMAEEDGFVKVIVDVENQKILGAHIIGPEASILVQQIVYLMNAGDGDYDPLINAQTIHPALSEVIIQAFGNLRHSP